MINILTYPVFALGLVLILWGVLMLPIKSEVKKRVGEDKYKEIVDEYKKMRRDRVFGNISFLLGIFTLLGVYYVINCEQIPSSELRIHAESAMIIPVIFICAGIYCYFMGFVKAMANLLRTSK